jgi:hypothetical protein
MTSGTNVDPIIRNAVLSRRCITFFAIDDGGSRFAEPHAYGVTHDGEEAILLWLWEAEGTESTAPGAWALVRLAEMHDVQVLERTFETPRPGYRRGDRRLPHIHAEV